jgi:N-acetylmuramoyl-L-alanine amidase
MSKLVVIDAGHGGKDPGAVGNNLKEKDLTLTIAGLTCDILESVYKINTLQTRPKDQFVSLNNRTSVANAAQANCLVSIHINAATPSANGFESFIYTTDVEGTRSYALQKAIHKPLAKHFDSDRGRKKANFHMVRECKGAAVLIELGFISNTLDASKLKNGEFLFKLAESLAGGIANYLGANKCEKPKSKHTYRVLVDGVQKAAYSDLDNLASEVKKHAEKGKSSIELQLIK